MRIDFQSRDELLDRLPRALYAPEQARRIIES